MNEKIFIFKIIDLETHKSIIPIFMQNPNEKLSTAISYKENQRLIQIAQKCFESVVNLGELAPIWKFDSVHAQNGAFVPTVCRMKDILSKYVPFSGDIIDDVLIPFI